MDKYMTICDGNPNWWTHVVGVGIVDLGFRFRDLILFYFRDLILLRFRSDLILFIL